MPRQDGSLWHEDYFIGHKKDSGRTFDLLPYYLEEFRERTCSRKITITIDVYRLTQTSRGSGNSGTAWRSESSLVPLSLRGPANMFGKHLLFRLHVNCLHPLEVPNQYPFLLSSRWHVNLSCPPCPWAPVLMEGILCT